MLACVVDCSQICQARSSNRYRPGCEDKLWPAERDSNDQNVQIQAFSDSKGGSGGTLITQCYDGSYQQPDSECIAATNAGLDSKVYVVDNEDAGGEEQPGHEENRDQVTGKSPDIRVEEEEASEKPSKQSLPVCSGIATSCKVTVDSSFGSRLPAKSSERSKLKPRRALSVDQKLTRLIESQVELRPIIRLKVGDGDESADNFRKGGRRGSGKKLQLAKGKRSSHEFLGEEISGLRTDERVDAQKELPSSWEDELHETQEQHLSFRGDARVECVSNEGEEEGFENFHVGEFQALHGQEEEPIQETDRTETRELHPRRGEQPKRTRDGLISSGAQFQSPEKALCRRAGTRRRTSEDELGESQPQIEAEIGVRRSSERVEAGTAGTVGKSQEKDDKLHARAEGQQRRTEPSEERKVRARLDSSGAGSGRGEDTEEAIKVVRPSRPSGGKDRHSKVNTAKGPRDRRVRLSVPTAVQFYDVQDRLGYDQPSKAVEWLIKKAKAAIDELGRLPTSGDAENTNIPDITHASPFPASLSSPLCGSSSCSPAGSFTAAVSTPFGDVGNHMGYFIDSSIPQGMSFGNHLIHNRDVGIMGLSPAHLATGQGHLAGLSFPLGQTDLSRGISGAVDGGKAAEFTGSPLARVESRVKARERARERAKEKGCGRDVQKVTDDASSPSSTQSPPLHQHTVQGSFTMIQNVMQSSIHSLSLPSPRQSPLQSSVASLFNSTLSGILQSSQQGALQNLILQNPPMQSPLADQVQSSLQHSFQISKGTLQSSPSMTSLNSGIQQQSHLQMPSLHANAQRGLHLGSGFSPGPCSSSFPDASPSSSHYISISPPSSQSLTVAQLSALGIPSSIGAHFPSASSAVPIPTGFSPGPPALAFRSRPMPISQGSQKEQQHLQGVSRPQLVLPSFSAASAAGTSSPKASMSPSYYATTSSRNFQSLKSPSFLPIRSYDYQRGLQMMSPGRPSSSSSQIPARIQGLDDLEGELQSASSSSPDVHP